MARLEPMAALTFSLGTLGILLHAGASWALLRPSSAVPRSVLFLPRGATLLGYECG